EARDLPAAAEPFDGMVWDGRYRLGLHGATDGWNIAPCGCDTALPGIDGRDDAPDSLVRVALAAEPALWRGGLCLGPLCGTGSHHGLKATPIGGPWARFLPSFDMEAARALAELLDAPPPPAPPLTGHNVGS